MKIVASVLGAVASGFASPNNKFSPQNVWADVKCPKSLL